MKKTILGVNIRYEVQHVKTHRASESVIETR